MFRNIPLVTRNFLIINVLAYFASVLMRQQGVNLQDIGGLHFFLASDFNVLQFISYQFLHGNFTHLFFNMFALWMFGCVIERVWGPRKFIFYYIACGVGAGLCQEIAQYVSYASEGLAAYEYVNLEGVGRMPVGDYLNLWCTVGASGAIYAILLAFGMTFPNERIFIFPLPVPIKAKWFVMIYAGIELVSAYTSPGDGVAHVAHLGGMLFGFILIRYWRKHPGDGLNIGGGRQFFERWSNRNWSGRGPQGGATGSANRGYQNSTRTETDAEYNLRKKQRQEEIDQILDKIRKSGYDSLTKDEKQRLFEASRER